MYMRKNEIYHCANDGCENVINTYSYDMTKYRYCHKVKIKDDCKTKYYVFCSYNCMLEWERKNNFKKGVTKNDY